MRFPRATGLNLTSARLLKRASRAELERDQRALLDAIRAGLRAESDGSASDAGFDAVRGLLTELSHTRARQNFTPTETCIAVFALKDAVLAVLGDQVGDHPEVFDLFTLVDQLGLFTFETYATAREKIIMDQSQQLLELSTPVVKLWDGILAVPLVGTLDSARTQVVMEKLLQGLVDTGSEHAIIDITGVPAVDTQVAQHLLKTAMAARLMGAECIISGIRPQIAQTIVTLGIEFGDIRKKATLSDALVTALRASTRERPDLARGIWMYRLPILKIGSVLLVSIQVDLDDQSVLQLQDDLTDRIVSCTARGVLIDISALEIVDSFLGRLLASMASISRALDARTVVVGMRPAVAITLVELGLTLHGVHTALDVDRGLALLTRLGVEIGSGDPPVDAPAAGEDGGGTRVRAGS